jgi:hypothetical protein
MHIKILTVVEMACWNMVYKSQTLGMKLIAKLSNLYRALCPGRVWMISTHV